MNLLTNIRARLIVLLLTLMVPASLLIYWSAKDSSERQIAQAKGDMVEIARHARNMLQNDIRSLQQIAALLDSDPAVHSWKEPDCSRALAALLKNPDYLGAVALDEHGNGRCNGSEADQSSQNHGERDYFKETMRSGQSVAGRPLVSRPAGRHALPVTTPIKNVQGKTVGMIAASLDLGRFGERFIQSRQASDAVFLMWDDTGNLLFRYPDAEKLSGRQFAQLPLVQSIAARGGEGSLEMAGFDNVQRTFGYATLGNANNANIYVAVSIPARTLYADANATLEHAVWAILIMLCIGVGAAWTIGRNLIWRPIKTLSHAVNRMAAGDYSTRVGAPYGRHEIGELARVFDQMAAANEAHNLQMKGINSTLEQRVAERTRMLEASEHKFRAVLESAADGFVIVDARGRIAIVNGAAEALFGYERDEMIGQPLEMLIPPPFRETHVAQRNGYETSPTTRGMGTRGAVEGLRKDGTVFFAGISLSSVATEDGAWTTAVVRDITAAINTDSELKRLNRTLRVLSECNGALVRAQEESELLDAICRISVNTGGYSLAWVGFALHDEGQSVVPVAQFGAHRDYVNNLHITWADTERGRGPTGAAIRERRTVIAHNLQRDMNFGPWRAQAQREGFASSVALPLKSKDGVLGTINLYSNDLNAFHAEEIKLLEELADDLGYGVGNLRERERRAIAERQLSYQANFDAVTGLANRSLLLDRLTQALLQAKRNARQVAVVLLDLDRFKAVNESHGHTKGDQLLKEVARRLVEALRQGDTIARLAADEFCLLMTDLSSAEDVATLAHKLLENVALPVALDASEIFVTGSVGIALFPKDSEHPEDLLQHAMSAMHNGKALGGNTFQFYAPDMNHRVATRLALDGALRRSLAQGELQVHYQPVVNLTNGEVVSAEALVRWQHPEIGMVSPVDFIPMAEESGLIVPLGTWVLNHTCAQMRQWLNAGLPVPPVAVNLSARQFRQDNLVQVVREALQVNALAPGMLTLEITESSIMADVNQAAKILRALKGLGVKLSLDDFGTGYSSLNYLKRFDADRLKIDRSFVHDITSDADDATICRAVIDLAHALSMKVIAEGVETEGQMNYLRRQFCDEMQGYYFSRPLPQAEFAQLLSDGKTLEFTSSATLNMMPTLLLVDDEERVLSSLIRLLRRGGEYRILTATSAAQAFELLAVNKVQVILTDQRMPNMKGTEFLRRVKDLYPDTVRMVLSGYADLNSVTEAINQGAIYKFFTKPWNEAALKEEIRGAFRYCAEQKDKQPPPG